MSDVNSSVLLLAEALTVLFLLRRLALSQSVRSFGI